MYRSIRDALGALSSLVVLGGFALDGDWTGFLVVLVGGLALTAALILWPRRAAGPGEGSGLGDRDQKRSTRRSL